MKVQGGNLELTQDADSLLCWAVAGPELVRVLSAFESSMIGITGDAAHTGHHVQCKATQKNV